MTSKNLAVPHSWEMENWPADIFPGTQSKAEYILRQYRKALFAAGAISRIGRRRVIIGQAYCKWLESQKATVAGYKFAGTPRHLVGKLANADEAA